MTGETAVADLFTFLFGPPLKCYALVLVHIANTSYCMCHEPVCRVMSRVGRVASFTVSVLTCTLKVELQSK